MSKKSCCITTSGDETEPNLQGMKQSKVSTLKLSEETKRMVNISKKNSS